jgi:hypothetical protein
MRRPSSQLGCCFADRINMADSVTNTGGITAAGSDLHFSDRIKVLYMEKYMGYQTLTSASYLYLHFGTLRMVHLCFFSSLFKFVPKLREGPTGMEKISE